MVFSKNIMVTISMFFVGIVFLLLSPIFWLFNALALIFIGVGFLMVGINMYKSYQNLHQKLNLQDKELLLEVATQEGSEKYVYKGTTRTNKELKQQKAFFREKKFGMLAIFFIGAAFIYLGIKLFF